MSALDDIITGARTADALITRLSPWWNAIAPLLPLLESGDLTPDQLTQAVEAAMLQAKRAQIAASEP